MLSPTMLRRMTRCTLLCSPRAARPVRGKTSASPSASPSKTKLAKRMSPPQSPQDAASSQKASFADRAEMTSPAKVMRSLAFEASPPTGAPLATTAAGVAASVNAIMKSSASDSHQWQYAYQQLRRLLPHSERLAPWQQHTGLLMACAEVALRLGEVADACTYALDAVDLHVAISCDSASINARLLAARALDKTGRRTESMEMYRSACTLVENGVAANEQTPIAGSKAAPLDAALPFVEFARFLETCGSDDLRVDILKKALKQTPTTPRTLCNAELLLARAYSSVRDHAEADIRYERAATKASDTEQSEEVLAEAALFAQHKLRSIDKAVSYFTRLFEVREPTPAPCAQRGELLLNAAVAFEQHPDHGCARAVGLYRTALDCFPPNCPTTHRLRLYLARAFAGSGQVDRAMEEYSALITDMTDIAEPPVQVDANGVRGILPLCEVHGHLALCLFQRVGDLNGAITHYQLAFEAAVHCRPAAPSRTLEWLHEGSGALFLRLGRHAEALQHLEEKIDLASRRNDPAVSAHLHAAASYEALQQSDSALQVYKYLFDLPVTASTRENRLEVALRFAWFCHYTLGDYNAAVTLYLAALHIDADNPHTMVQAAWCMLQLPQHDIAEVEALYTSAALAAETARHSKQPSQWDECYVLGECAVFHHDVTKKVALAEELYMAALATKNSDNFAQVAANFAVFLHYEKKDSASAMSWFEGAIAANPDLPAATTLFADFLINTNRLDRAVQELQRLLPTHRAEAWHKLGRIAERLVANESFDSAIAAYCKALGAPDTEHDEAVSDEDVLKYCGQAETAQLPIVNDLLMLLHYKTRRIALVDALYARMTVRFPNEVHLVMHYARFSVDVLKKKTKAHRLFRAAVNLDPSNITVLDHYAEFLVSSKPDRLDAAEAVHLHSLRLNPNSAQAHFNYASFLAYVYKAPSRAEHHFKTAISIDPNDPLTLCCYATFLEFLLENRYKNVKDQQQMRDCAEWMHREAVRLGPSNASLRVFLANCLWRQRRHSETWPVLQGALQLEPGNVVTLRLAATFLQDWYTALSSVGTTTDVMDLPTMASTAEALFKRALSLAPTDVGSLRSFAKFMEDVRNDHAAALSIDAAATRIELAEHDAAMGDESVESHTDDHEDDD